MIDMCDAPDPHTADDTRCADLKRMIAKLGGSAAPAHDGARLLGAPAQAGSVAAILDEIDETVMARRLLFRNEHGEIAVVEVRNRRLLRAAFGDGTGDAQAGQWAALSYAGAGDIAALRAALSEFCRGGAIRVVSETPRRVAGAEETGVSVPTLRQAMHQADRGEVADTTDELTRLHRFCVDCTPWTLAWAIDGGGGDTASHGEGMMVSRLIDALGGFRQSFGAGSDPRPASLMLTAEPPALGSLGFFADAAAWAVLAVAPGCEDAILVQWSERIQAVA